MKTIILTTKELTHFGLNFRLGESLLISQQLKLRRTTSGLKLWTKPKMTWSKVRAHVLDYFIRHSGLQIRDLEPNDKRRLLSYHRLPRVATQAQMEALLNGTYHQAD